MKKITLLHVIILITLITSCTKRDDYLDYGQKLSQANGGSSSGGSSSGSSVVGSGQAYSFGLNNWGQLGFTGAGVSVATALNDGHDWVQLSSLRDHSCGITDTGDAYCWGEGSYGKLGNNSIADKDTPTLVVGGHSWKSISAGSYHTCGVTTADEAYCWGWNHLGALGDNTFVDSWVPTKVLGAFTWKIIAAGYDVTCAVTTAGVAYCFGDGGNGVTGNADYNIVKQPTAPVLGGFVWDTLVMGPDHACGITTGSVTYCWGGAGQGQLGDGANNWTDQPGVAVVGGHTFKKIFSGQYHVCGITTADDAYCWGYNNRGQLGGVGGAGGPGANLPTPTLVVGGHSWSKIEPGYEHTCGVTTTGTAYCWGKAANGELGNGSLVDQASPVLVSGGYTWSDIATGDGFTIGLQ